MKRVSLLLIFVLLLLSAACQAEVDVDATVAAAIAATEAAQPTNTPEPSPTPLPTETPVPPTETPLPPTATPLPATETPTAVPAPTDEPAAATDLTGVAESGFAETTLENGWTQYTSTENGFAIAFPPEWTAFALDPEFMADALSDVGAQNPAFGDFFSNDLVRNLAASGIKLYAIDTDADAISQGTPTSVNVLQVELPFEFSLDEYLEINISQLETMGGDGVSISSEKIDLNGMETAVLRYEMPLTNIVGETDQVRFEQYLIIDDQTAIVLTMASVTDLADRYETLFPEIAQTFMRLEE